MLPYTKHKNTCERKQKRLYNGQVMDKEHRGIYNVTFNDKKATPILKDIEAIEDAVIEYIAMYVKGFHLERRDKGRGAEHIKLHLKENSKGEIKLQELLDIGHSLREYLKNFSEPFIDEKGAKIYEWENKEGIRFRTIVDRIDGQGHTSTTFHPSNEQIISFYSDRNFNKQMEFKNPKVTQYYQNNKDINSSTLNVSDSTLAKMQQKIEAFAQKGFRKEGKKRK